MIRRKPNHLFFMLSLLFILLSCSTQKEHLSIPASENKALLKGEKPVAGGWEEEWNRTLQEAKKEGRVIVYGTVGGDTRSDIIQGFRKKHSIDIDYISGKGGEISQKVLTERRAGLFTTDVYV